MRDGAGDLEGIRRHLDHIAELGADAMWLSPIFTSPMADFGYDVADYCGIDPLFGDDATFDALVRDAHERDIRILLDWVPNHTSSEHPWFREARSSRDNPKRDWYIWRDPDPEDPSRPPNNWLRAFGVGPAWTFDEPTGQWYLHLFLPEQPDLNWANPEVEAAMFETLDYWLDRGVDGFRIDVTHGLSKPRGLPDSPPALAEIPYSGQIDDPGIHPILKRLRAHLDERAPASMVVGEVFLIDAEKVAPYYGNGDGLHLAFNFAPMFSKFTAGSFRRRIDEIERLIVPVGIPTWVLSSHDRPRHRTRYGGSERRARAVAVVSLSLRGAIFLYAGEELGLEDAVVPDALEVDPGGRDGCRAPLPWTAAPQHGWELEGREPWLPFPPESSARSVERELVDGGSVLALYRRLVAERRGSAALRHGGLELVGAGHEELLGYWRREEDDERLVLANFADVALDVAVGKGLTVAVGSGGDGALAREGEAFSGRLGPEEAVILRP